jgi:hypothetical protein
MHFQLVGTRIRPFEKKPLTCNHVNFITKLHAMNDINENDITLTHDVNGVVNGTKEKRSRYKILKIYGTPKYIFLTKF